MPRRYDHVPEASPWSSDDHGDARRPPPRRSLPLRPQTSSPVPLDYIPPCRPAGGKTTQQTVTGHDEFLSADAATRVMLEKWDLLDSTDSPRPPRATEPEGARRRRPIRSSSVPSSGFGRRKSRVREWEEWKPEMERIRLAQVEMERKLEQEAKAHQMASMGGPKTESGQTKQAEPDEPKRARDRKPTPRYPRLEDSDECADSHATMRLSPLSAAESTKAVYEGSGSETARPRSQRAQRPPSRSSRRARRPVKVPSPTLNNALDPDVEDTTTESTPLSPPFPTPRSRSARRKPRPASPTSSSAPPPSPPPRHSRSSRNRRRPSPPAESTESPAPDFLSSATHAAEQVSDAVSNALNKVLPGLFGAGGGRAG
ncbi:hypothetical protein JCM11491_004472 [Sporobolomyces phaffii]